jgi:histidinol-phosphate aminotransferase
MPRNFLQLPHVGIQNLAPYIPGKSARELQQEQGINNIIKLASNENPLGCSPLVIEKLGGIAPADISIYHPTAVQALRAQLAQKLGVGEHMIFLANGSDAIFPLVLMSFALHRAKQLLVQKFGFNVPVIQAQVLGIPIRTLPVNSAWLIDVEQLISWCTQDIGIVYLANPNNPTGTKLSEEAIAHILESIPDSCMFLLDEAYHEYQENFASAVPLLAKYPNLIITRTFSKAYGLAGLRLGYAIGHSSVISVLQKIVLSFSVNYYALIAGEVALEDQAFVQLTRQSNEHGLKQIKSHLDDMGFSYLPTFGNFITIDCKQDGKPIIEALQREGIIIRPLHPYNMSNFIRVSIGTQEQNAQFLEAFTNIAEDI